MGAIDSNGTLQKTVVVFDQSATHRDTVANFVRVALKASTEFLPLQCTNECLESLQHEKGSIGVLICCYSSSDIHALALVNYFRDVDFALPIMVYPYSRLLGSVTADFKTQGCLVFVPGATLDQMIHQFEDRVATYQRISKKGIAMMWLDQNDNPDLRSPFGDPIPWEIGEGKQRKMLREMLRTGAPLSAEELAIAADCLPSEVHVYIHRLRVSFRKIAETFEGVTEKTFIRTMPGKKFKVFAHIETWTKNEA